MSRSDIPDWQRQAARRLRRNMTRSERALWHALRAHRFLGMSFRRQAPVGPYIVDFVCHAAKLVVEVDGGQHAGASRDARRDEWMARQGYRVLRFWNSDVLGNLPGVLDTIGRAAASAPPPRPSPTRGEGAPVAPASDATANGTTAGDAPTRRERE